MKRIVLLVVCGILAAQFSWAARAKIETISEDPYISALVIDSDTGKTLFEKRADTIVYPASVLKLMVLLVVLEQIEQGNVKLDDMVQVTQEAARMGGSQVYLDSKEQFFVEDLLYALIIQSANDAAVALATHVAGSKEGMVALMNKRAAELGMKNSRFYSVHGLPPSEGQKVDKTTARDLALLCRELAKRPDTFRYTGTKERDFRDGKFVMRTHNHLLAQVDGCDGFKTGYFKAAGFSMAVTAKRGGVRIITIVLGSKDRKVRDAKAAELLAKGFSMVPPRMEAVKAKAVLPGKIPQQKAVQNLAEKEVQMISKEPLERLETEERQESVLLFDNGWVMFLLGVAVGLVPFVFLVFTGSGKKSNKRRRLL